MTEPRAPEVVPPPPPGPPGQPPLPPDGIPKASVARRKRRQISLVWVIPAIAVMIGIWLVVTTVRTQGPTIDIQFKTAEGLEAGKTRIKYKNVDIGTVQTITLGQERKGVVVTAKMTRNATDLLVDDTRFWIVKPRIAGGQISGLTTLLSGSYIGMDIGKSPESRREFVGLDTQPSVTTDEPGREFLLHAGDSGSLDIGSPVFFRRFQVGEVTAMQLDADGKGVTARVFIRSPNEKYVTQNTRFWEASGVDVSIDGAGVRIATQSLASVVVGGIAFQTPEGEPSGNAAVNDSAFTLFTTEALAMKRTDAQLEKYVTFFTDSIRGLSVGAPVEFRGYVVGEVRSIEMTFDRTSREFRFPVEFVLYRDVLPARIARAERNGTPVDSDAAYARAIEKRGLRAQLRSGNLLTGAKFLNIDFFKNAAPVDLASTRDESGNRIIPAIPGTFDELQETLASIAKKIEKIPFEQLAGDLRRTLQQVQTSLKGADKLVTTLDRDLAPEVAATLAEVRRTVKNANEVLASDAPVQQDLRSTLSELSRSAISLRHLTDYLQRHPESLLRGKATDAPPSSTYVAPVDPGPVEKAKMNRPLQKLVLVGAVAAVAACSTPAATERFYALTDGGPAAPVPGAAATTAPLTVVFAAVTVPQLVDRPQIVTLDGANRVSVSEQNQWAEPLSAAIGRTLAARLSRSLAGAGQPARVAAWPQNSIASPDLRVTVDVQRFEAVRGGPVRVDALWTVRRSSGAAPALGRTSTIRDTTDASYDAVVSAWSDALAPLERDIATAIGNAAR